MGEEVLPTNETSGIPEDQTVNDQDGAVSNNGGEENDNEVSNSNALENAMENDAVKDTDAVADENNNIGIEGLNDDQDNAGEEIEKEPVKDDGGETTEAEVEEGDADQVGESAERPASAPTPSNEQHESDKDATEQGKGEEEEGKEEGGEQQEGGEAEPPKAPGSPTGTASTLKVKSAVRKHTTTPADDSGLAQPILPAIPRGQAKVQQIASSISDARKKHFTGQPTVYPIRNRVPPKLVRLATVTVSPAKTRPNPHAPSLYYEEPRKPQKVITWDEANNARPPLRVDMEGPGPCSYSPLNKPLNETNAPCFSFGTKCFPEKPAGIGSRTSWSKSWFQSNHPYHLKADYTREGLWPSPTHYPKPKTLGVRQRTMYEAPSYTFGHKGEFSMMKPGAHKEPSPTDYERQTADKQILRRGPSFSHQFRREGTVLWGCTESNPGPAAYTPVTRQRQQKPSYTIQGIRRSKSHILGPFSSI